MKYLLRLFFKIKINNFNHYKNAKKGTIFISNFTSYLDIFIYTLFLPKKPIIAVKKPLNTGLFLKLLFKLFKINLINQNNPSAIIKLIKKIKDGHNCIIFPESRPNYKGSIAKIYEDSILIAQKSNSDIIAINICGSANSIFAKKNNHLKQKIRSNINIYFSKSITIKSNKKLDPKTRRNLAKKEIFKIMSENNYDAIHKDKTLFAKLLDSKNHFKNKIIFTDFNNADVSYRKLVIGSILLGEKIAKTTKSQQKIGILLPNISGALITFFAMQLIGKIPAILNFSNGTQRLLNSIENSDLKYIYSSKLFIKKAKLEDFIKLATNKNIKIIYLEDVKANITIINKIKAIFKAKFITKYLNKINKQKADDIAVILFTSGSEGNPKGVALSHKNINSNIAQLQSIIDFNPCDKAFNALPIFHSFGLVIGSLLPILSGIKTYFYPSPIDYNKIPNLIYDFEATITFGTNYFLKKYSNFADNLDFSTVRYIFAGAEKITTETKNIYFEKYGIRILEGYGATETSPVVCLNTPRSNKFGTIGQLLPKISHKIEEIKDVDKGGSLLVKADNVMKGYLDPKNPDKIKKRNIFYNMGDVVQIDDDGHVTITGRVKRFIKIAGEMVSLNIVESYIRQISPDHIHAVTSFIDKNSREDMILFTEDNKLTSKKIKDFFDKNNISTLFLPRNIAYRKDIPILNTGKIDYNDLKK